MMAERMMQSTSTSRGKTKGRTTTLIALLGFCLLSINVIDFSPKLIHRNLRNELNEFEQRLNEIEDVLANQAPRPVMHTFFEPVAGGCCGMSEQGHRNLIKAWEDAWQSFGWDTKVLTEEDARRHPDFELFQQKMSRANVSDYNRRCFWRWLALAMLDDGGWLSDYDNIPLTLTADLGRELMQQPGFKTWGLHVPALIHGDQASLLHIVGLMRLHISPDLHVEHMSDMHVLKYLVEKLTTKGMGATLWRHRVYPGFPYVNTTEGPIIHCNSAKRFLTAHLSHYDSQKAYDSHRYPHIDGMTEGEFVEKRAEAAGVMLRDFRENCIG